MTPEQKQFLENMTATVAEGRSINEAIAVALPKLKGVENIGDIHEAVKQLEKNMTKMLSTSDGLMARSNQLSWNRNGQYRGVFGDENQAMIFGLYVDGIARRDATPADYEAFIAEYKNYYQRDYSTDPGASGGLLQGTDFLDQILSYFEEFGGVYAKAAKMPVGGAELGILKETGRGSGNTAGVYLVGEGSSPTTSDDAFSTITLHPREWARLVYYPRKLARTARTAIRVGEMIARSIGYSFRKAYDYTALQGTGSVSDLRVTGVIPSLTNLDATIANIAGLVVGTGNAWSELTLQDHLKVIGAMPEIHVGGAEWTCSRQYFFTVMVKLMLAQGGSTAADVGGRIMPIFQGDPVNLTSIMPRVEANSQVAALYANIYDCVMVGESMRLTIEESKDYKWAERQVGVMGLVDTDVQVTNVGNASATASEREVGAAVGLITAAA